MCLSGLTWPPRANRFENGTGRSFTPDQQQAYFARVVSIHFDDFLWFVIKPQNQ